MRLRRNGAVIRGGRPDLRAQSLEQAGDMITTMFITDARYGPMAIALICYQRKSSVINFPASALVTVTGLARPEMLVEVQGSRGTWPKSRLRHRSNSRIRFYAANSGSLCDGYAR
jgi:hypothetical protein